MMEARTFVVVVEPAVLDADEGGWHVHLPEIEGCRSWGACVEEARANIREALSARADILGPEAAAIARTAMFVESECPVGVP
jgi:hypothetical protein